ncbi:MAG: tRNA epoxyqueuosine(34) reductase QueG [Planctomycetota bacterium]|jgi:epoxyqueuosine reductase
MSEHTDGDALLSGLRAECARVGFELVGVAPVSDVGAGWLAPHAARLEAWIEAGMGAEMAWLAERAAERVAPSMLLPDARVAVCLWMTHATADVARPDGPRGRVARYAWGRDYHNVVRKALRKVRRWLLRAAPETRTYLSIDTGAVLERAWAERAGVGWIGKSSMLIHPRLGTFGSLAVMFLDLDLPTEPSPHPGRCGTCTACLDLCPTSAIVAPGVVDARRCISYWTIEHRGIIPVEVRPLLGEWVFGCDVCQDVCPWNRDAPTADPAIWRPIADRVWPDLVDWISAAPGALAERLIGSPLMRARPEGLRRNALICAANGGHTAALEAAEAVLRDDPDPVLRATAAWAARALGSPTAAARAARDSDPRVRAEASSPLPAAVGVR